jgi:hypothetical protein
VTPEVETTDPEEQEQDVYPPRTEDDIVEVIGSMEDVDDEDLEDAVRQISELADNNLRTGNPSVRVHADAPIRSLVNPDENTVEIQEKYRQDKNTILSNPEAVEAFNKLLHDQEPPTKEAELVGEEYYMAQTLPGFQDVGNIKWWSLMDEGSYREETRGPEGREHLNLENEGEIHGYRIELDGEPLTPEQAQNLSLMMNIRDSEGSGLERNRIPELITRYDSTEEVLESEDIDESDYLQQIQEAQRDGLITEEGDLTLKGWTSTADMQARDLRRLEEHDRGDRVIFNTLSHSDIPFMTEDDVVEHDARLELNASTGDQRSAEGRVERGDLQGELVELADQIEDLTGFRIDDTTEEVEEDYSVGLRELYSSLRGQEIPEDVVGSMEGEMRDNIIEVAASNGSLLSVSDPEYSIEIDRGDSDELEELMGCHPDRIEQELNENTSLKMTDRGVRLVYEGDDEGMVAEIIDDLTGSIYGFRTEVEDGRISTNIRNNVLNESYLELIDRLDDPAGHPISHQYGMIGSITSYEERDKEFRDAIEELEEEGFIDTELRWGTWSNATVKPTAKNPREYREAIQTIEELDFVETPKTTHTQTWRQRTQVDLDDVMVEMEITSEDDEKVSEILGDAEDELREKANIPRTHESEMVPDYEYYGPSNLIELANKTLDVVDSEHLTGLARKVVDEPEMEEKMSFPRYISDLNEEVEDYDHGYSDELVEGLRELQEQGMLEVQREIKGHGPRECRSMEYTDINGQARVDYSELGEDQIEELRRLETQGLIELDEPLRAMSVTDLGESDHEYSINLEMTAEEVDIDDVERTARVSYTPGDEQVHEADPRLKDIGDRLDPLNLDTKPYEEVTVENRFDYGDALV